MPQDSVKPGRHVFLIAQLVGSFDRLEETVLHDIRRQVGITHPTTDKVGELLQFTQQVRLDLVRIRLVSGRLCHVA
jgi:hypothetical protein